MLKAQEWNFSLEFGKSELEYIVLVGIYFLVTWGIGISFFNDNKLSRVQQIGPDNMTK